MTMAILGWALVAQSGTGPLVSVNAAMTPHEQEITGVGSQTQAQRAAFSSWLDSYTRKIVAAIVDTYENYGDVKGKHWITEVNGGALIRLDDGSLWEVSDLDRVDTGLWLSTDDVIVLNSQYPVGDYRYELLNTDEQGETATVMFLGDH